VAKWKTNLFYKSIRNKTIYFHSRHQTPTD
jgi:hypothetical protein